MRIERLRELFVFFLKENQLEKYLICDSSSTVQADSTLKYERIDRYRITLLTLEDLNRLCAFCKQHDILLWFWMGQLCIGYNYMSNMRLIAYEHTEGKNYLQLKEQDDE